MDEELINVIKKSYNINSELKSSESINGYPHIKILTFDKNYFIKKVNNSFCKNINTLYNYLAKSSYVKLPIKTINDEYALKFNGEQFLIYSILKEFHGEVDPFWWAKALESIHNIDVNKKDFSTKYTIDKECFDLLNKVNELLSYSETKQINKLLDNYYYDGNIDDMVLSHGDACDDNVMIYKSYVKLIDTDKMRLLPKEFDIQRLFVNEVNRKEDFDEIAKYFRLFFYNYNGNIDFRFLKKLYVTDLLRTFSWLLLVSQDETREDLFRQKKELKKYRDSILSEKHYKILKKL